LGRRIKKVVSKSGEYDKTEVYLYDGQKIIEIRNGSNAMVQQFIAPLTRRSSRSEGVAKRHADCVCGGESRADGTQYIDELVMVRVASKGDLYVHQDANWNVVGLTDLGGHLVERYVYSPYGELIVDQSTGFGDRDGDGKVDSTDKGTVGTTCTGTVSGSCRILDLDFDGDYDSTDAGKFDNLSQGLQLTPGKLSTAVSQPFAHQGLLFEPEIVSYQNRARQYDPAKRRFAQRDPLSYKVSLNVYVYANGNSVTRLDPTGRFPYPGLITICRWAEIVSRLADELEKARNNIFTDYPSPPWTETGFIIYIDENGNITVVGPIKDINQSNGGDPMLEGSDGTYGKNHMQCNTCKPVIEGITHGPDWPAPPPGLPTQEEVNLANSEAASNGPPFAGVVIQDTGNPPTITLVPPGYTGPIGKRPTQP